jgi:L-asparaginase
MIKVFTTGGTIAKRYDEITGRLIFDEAHLEKILGQGRCEAVLSIEPLMLKDSLDMTREDREAIFKQVEESKEKYIMITHGTDTMVETAQKLSTIQNKSIVLVGAMIPYAFKNSDALFNVGCALGALSSLDVGVYIVMNGKVFAWDGVKKDKKKGVFIVR